MLYCSAGQLAVSKPGREIVKSVLVNAVSFNWSSFWMSKIVQQMRYLIGCFRSARWLSNVSKMLIKHYDNIKDVIKEQ